MTLVEALNALNNDFHELLLSIEEIQNAPLDQTVKYWMQATFIKTAMCTRQSLLNIIECMMGQSEDVINTKETLVQCIDAIQAISEQLAE